MPAKKDASVQATLDLFRGLGFRDLGFRVQGFGFRGVGFPKLGVHFGGFCNKDSGILAV